MHIGRWLVGASFALLILAGFALFPPHLSVDHAPHYLADESDSHGFFSPETDPAGNRFVWTEPHAATTFTSIGRQPAVLHLMLRSAAVAGGPDAPIRLIVNGEEVQHLRPDPHNLAFQLFSVPLPRVMHGRITVELAAEAFRPRKGDPRTLGTMVQGVGIDQHAAWSQVAARYWLYDAWAPLGALVAFLALAARRAAVAQPPLRVWSARSSYAAVLVSFLGSLCMAAMVGILLWIGPIDAHRSIAWLLGSLYLGGISAAAALRLPWGEAGSPSLWSRFRRVPLVEQSWPVLTTVRNVALLALPIILALHFLPSPGTGDVQDKLRWMHSMAADGLVRGFQESHDDYPPGTYVVLFAGVKIASLLHIGYFIAYKLSLLLFLVLSSAVLLRWTRNALLVAALQAALVVGSAALGYNDVYFIPFLLLALWALRAKRLVWFSALFTLTCLMKWQPAILAPVFLIYLVGTITEDEQPRRVRQLACRVILPATVILVGALIGFGKEFLLELHRATSENFLSANALNVDWIVTHILSWWNPQRFGFAPETHRRFIRVPNTAALALLKIPFFAVYLWILVRFARGPKSFGTMLWVAYAGYAAYFLLNTSVHENHLVPAIVLGGLLATYDRRYVPLFLATSLVTNVNMVLFYGVDGVPRLPMIVRGVDISLILAAINVVLFVVLIASGSHADRDAECWVGTSRRVIDRSPPTAIDGFPYIP
ncbi:MAG: hypothetical protein M3Y58_07330 [Chloroflexota bacterium]|nr:hypothetical protein [Chloroflexota bacterium]